MTALLITNLFSLTPLFSVFSGRGVTLSLLCWVKMKRSLNSSHHQAYVDLLSQFVIKNAFVFPASNRIFFLKDLTELGCVCVSSLKNSLNAVRQSRSEGSDMPCGANTLAFSLVTVLQINDQRCDCCACENKSFRFIHVFPDKTKMCVLCSEFHFDLRAYVEKHKVTKSDLSN